MTRFRLAAVLCLLVTAPASGGSTRAQTGPSPLVANRGGLQLLAVTASAEPTLRVVLRGRPTSDRSIEVRVPEHVTALRRGSTAAEQLFLPSPNSPGSAVAWRAAGRAIEYERDLPGPVRLLARATLEDDGVRFQYELTNRSSTAFDMITAVTDPRLTGTFHDVRLERTYVHHVDGFDLLASGVPGRLTLPLDRWLPARVLASFTWPVAPQGVEQRGDGITYYHKARAVDVPLIVTRSTDGEWFVASFARAPGNIWSNPELTCQHVDPQAPLLPQQRIVLEVKMLVMRGSLDDALRVATRQRAAMK
jgi:hypothetical protein